MLDKVMNILTVILMVAEECALGFLIWAWRRDRRKYGQ